MTGFTYKSYVFVDKDPIIDQIRTVFQDSRLTYKKVEELSGVSDQTLRKWFDGDTRRPQAASINAVLRSLGYKLEVVRIGENAIVPATPAPPSTAKPTSVRHVVAMAKYRKRS